MAQRLKYDFDICHAASAGAVYLMLKALSYVLRSVWNSAVVTSTLATMRSSVGL